MSAGATKCQVGPEQVGAEDVAAIERILHHRVGALHDTLADGPLGTGIVLGLDRTEPGDDFGGCGESGPGEALVPEAVAEEAGHGAHARNLERQAQVPDERPSQSISIPWCMCFCPGAQGSADMTFTCTIQPNDCARKRPPASVHAASVVMLPRGPNFASRPT